MGAVSFGGMRPAPAAPPPPVFYTQEFVREYGQVGTPGDAAATDVATPPPPAPAPSIADLKAVERARVLAEIREEEMGAAEVAAKRLGAWAAELQGRQLPCTLEQEKVMACYASPPGGDQLRSGPLVDAYVRCAKL